MTTDHAALIAAHTDGAAAAHADAIRARRARRARQERFNRAWGLPRGGAR